MFFFKNKLVKLILSIYLFTNLLSGCNYFFTPTFPQVNLNTDFLVQEINNRNIKIKNESIPIKISNKYGFPRICRQQNPPVVYNDCLSILVEGETNDLAIESANKIMVSLKTLKLSDLATKKLDKKTVVLTPAVRDKEHRGGTSPYAMSKYFKTSPPLIFKIGD